VPANSGIEVSAGLALSARDMQIASYGLGAEIPRRSGVPVIFYLGKKGWPDPSHANRISLGPPTDFGD
jgi:hypothetical protein